MGRKTTLFLVIGLLCVVALSGCTGGGGGNTTTTTVNSTTTTTVAPTTTIAQCTTDNDCHSATGAPMRCVNGVCVQSGGTVPPVMQ